MFARLFPGREVEAFSQFRVDHGMIYAAGSAASALSVAGLAMYGAAFQRKTRNL